MCEECRCDAVVCSYIIIIIIFKNFAFCLQKCSIDSDMVNAGSAPACCPRVPPLSLSSH